MKIKRCGASAMLALMACALNPAFAGQAAAGKTAFKANPRLAALGDNTVMDLGPFKWQRPAGEPHTGAVTDYSGMTYDPHHNRVLLFGGGHSATWTDAIYAFDFSTLQWKALYTPTPHKFYSKENMDRGFWKAGLQGGNYPRPVGRHTYDLLIVPPDRKEFLMLRTGTGPSSASRAAGIGYTGGAGGIYDFKSGKWTIVPTKSMGNFGGYGGSAEYDPISKKVIGMNTKHVWAFDPEKRTTEKIMNWYSDKKEYKGATPYSGSLVYCPLDKNIYVFGHKKGRMAFWKLELDRSNLKKSRLVKIGNFPAEKKGYPVFQYDARNKLLVGGPSNNTFYAFDPLKKTWTSQAVQGGQPGALRFWCLAYSPVENVYLFISSNRHTWAYRWKK